MSVKVIYDMWPPKFPRIYNLYVIVCFAAVVTLSRLEFGAFRATALSDWCGEYIIIEYSVAFD